MAQPTHASTPAKKQRTTPGEFVRQVRAEANKIVWPTWPETARTAVFVGILVLILSLFFLAVDSVFGYTVRELLGFIG
ncbi:preprotein translocase subunit SecE [Aurantiacibacter luteus]|uniref:Protein translocase subunit SecE n=1 Tax=Aurantiacibacter luteus TaxID=1581420 RepID=A0A0G9MZG5_9SPHN|nr:preprotein translocase subunit SecE [Aurantiacibacter luteus]KLE34653.1 preprotein translocase subunit SecE [Aurantiacibacter luteus]